MITVLNIRVTVVHNELVTPEALKAQAISDLGGTGHLVGLNNLGPVEHVKVECEIAPPPRPATDPRDRAPQEGRRFA